jgi:hypothetical protein
LVEPRIGPIKRSSGATTQQSKRAIDKLSTGRKRLKTAIGNDWMKDTWVDDH